MLDGINIILVWVKKVLIICYCEMLNLSLETGICALTLNCYDGVYITHEAKHVGKCFCINCTSLKESVLIGNVIVFQ